jgi:hypothetical protein
MGEMLPCNEIPAGRHHFMLATYNIDPIKLFVEDKKKKKKKKKKIKKNIS